MGAIRGLWHVTDDRGDQNGYIAWKRRNMQKMAAQTRHRSHPNIRFPTFFCPIWVVYPGIRKRKS